MPLVCSVCMDVTGRRAVGVFVFFPVFCLAKKILLSYAGRWVGMESCYGTLLLREVDKVYFGHYTPIYSESIVQCIIPNVAFRPPLWSSQPLPPS